MSCRSCDAARTNPLTGLYHANCAACRARSLAKSLPYFASQRAGEITPQYRASLERVFGENWKAGHQAAREWAEKLKERKC